MLTIGDFVPDFTLDSSEGTPFTLHRTTGKRIVLFFYPKDLTPGCTQESCDFRDHYDALCAKGVVVVGISPDSLASHAKFIAKHQLPFPLLSDPDHHVSTQFGVWVEKSMYGKTYMGIERATFLIDASFVLRQAWRKVKVKDHVQTVLQSL